MSFNVHPSHGEFGITAIRSNHEDLCGIEGPGDRGHGRSGKTIRSLPKA